MHLSARTQQLCLHHSNDMHGIGAASLAESGDKTICDSWAQVMYDRCMDCTVTAGTAGHCRCQGDCWWTEPGHQ